MPTLPPTPDVRQRLRTARLRWTASEVIRGVLLVGAGVGLAFLVGVGAEGALWMGVGLRTALFWLLAALALGLVGAFVLPPVLRGLGLLPGMDDSTVAHRADRFREGAGDRLLALRDLQASGARGESPLQAAAVAALGREVEDVPVEHAEDRRGLWRSARWALAPALGFVLALLLIPGPFEAAAERLLSPGEAFYPPASFSLSLQPGDVEIVRGESVEITARPAGKDWPLDATLEVRREGETVTDDTRLLLGDDGLWRHTVEDVRQSAQYRVRALGVVTDWASIRVVARPLVRGLNVVLLPPGYSGRPARALPEGVGDVSGLAGSTVRLTVGLAGERAARGEVRIRWDDSTASRVPLAIGAEGATARFPLRRGGHYSLHLETASGVANTNPARYSLGVLGDGAPQITLVDGASGALDARGRRLEFRVSDDFGFSGGSLIWRVIRGDARGPLRRAALPVRTRPLGQDVGVTFRPTNVGPGDVVEFFGEVVDNGPRRQRARTPVVTLRFPSLAQRIDELEAQRDSTRDDLQELRDNAKEASERFERFRDDLRRNPNPDWEDQRQIEELRRQQEDLGRQSDALQQRMEKLQRDMQDSGLADPETMRKLEQMRQVMQELDSPELRDALKRLQEAMEKLDMREMMEQAEQAEFNEEEFRQRLDRAMELLERFETAVDLKEAAQLAEDLAEREAEIQAKTEALENASKERRDGTQAESPEASGDMPKENTAAEREQVAQEQERAAESAEALEKQMEELRERMEEMRGQQGEQPMQDAQQEMQKNGGLPEQMQENAEKVRQNQTQEAQQQQQEMRRQLRKMAQKMRESSSQMQGQQQQIDTARLRAALEDVLTLSAEQERLAGETAATPGRSPALRPLARRQAELRTGLQHVADSLQSIGRTVPQLGSKIRSTTTSALREMGGAVEEFAEQRSGPAAARQRTAMTSLNELAVMLADVLSQLQNQQQQGGGQGQGTPQQMQQMGQQQQQLNQQIQQMLNQSAGERLSRDDQQRMRQLAEQQEAIRRQLKQMLEGASGGGGNEDGGPGGLSEQAKSQLRRIEEQMGEAAEQLRRGNPDPSTLPRQQNILQKLLEAERSANEQGREEKREAETARTTPPPASGGTPPRDRPEDRVRRDLIRALESGFSPDYQDLIKSYFGRIQGRASN
ncbi:DUF4175 family protein [Rubricoccus marinus]|uniref:DUF4175 domain-containing protein n=1 Tax=Rubricoccus marinus TaxID=716817 RepID=A0A259TYQ4_9BACT|nr:DUF4175 family protein [Rubricoccus marinus]OZC02905.1 hypothetical protein BSZ36_07920 [Rubricoccus marinus]